MSKDGTGEYIAAANDTMGFGENDFTVDFYFKVGVGLDFGKAAPADGSSHHVAVTRGRKKTTIHGNEYIEGVLFCFAKTYGEDGKLETAQHTRADLVKG